MGVEKGAIATGRRVDAAARLAVEIDTALRARGIRERAEHEKAYLKSALGHYGVSVPAIRAVARTVAARHPRLTHGELLELVDTLWTPPVHERRMAAVELLDVYNDRLGSRDIDVLEHLLRESQTWALVDPVAARVTGRLVEDHPELVAVLDRWAEDQNFWIRRATLLVLLGPLRRGDGDFDRFAGYADAMLADTEFFIRKAIGWVLRDTGKRRPDLVFAWLLPRASRASAVTIREAIKPLSESQRRAIIARR